MIIKRKLGHYNLFLIYFLGVFISSCTKKDLAEIITHEVTSITQTTASCGGTITAEGGSTILLRGVCWVQKPGLLTTFRREDYYLHTQLNNKYLTSALGGQICPANYGQVQWFFHTWIGY